MGPGFNRIPAYARVQTFYLIDNSLKTSPADQLTADQLTSSSPWRPRSCQRHSRPAGTP